ncbi:MAG TPA: hypothetical protein VGS98_11645 [Thermoanaerobaculia bacterium]|nr:hypothetical protein [Thermoanaerobaculia bacterium]
MPRKTENAVGTGPAGLHPPQSTRKSNAVATCHAGERATGTARERTNEPRAWTERFARNRGVRALQISGSFTK